jgi:catalase
MWINTAGEKFWLKYHFISDQGVDFLTQDEADHLAGADGDYHMRDLYQAIDRGEYPSWTLKVQVMPFEEAKTYRFNPFDMTKVLPHGDYPLIEVGKMTLDRNPTDNHTEIEQAAFEPSNLVPGIGPSPDKMLLGRMFSYPDAHRARIGANYNLLPVNAPKSPVHSYSKDGAMRFRNVSDPAARKPTPCTMASRRAGTPTERWCTPPKPCTPMTTTGARPAPWSATYLTTPPARGWSATSSGTCSMA